MTSAAIKIPVDLRRRGDRAESAENARERPGVIRAASSGMRSIPPDDARWPGELGSGGTVSRLGSTTGWRPVAASGRSNALAGAGKMHERASLGSSWRPAQVEEKHAGQTGSLPGEVGAVEDAAPCAGNALRKLVEVGAELHVPAPGRRQERDGLFKKRQELHPRPEHQICRPAGISEEGFRQDARPPGIAGISLPRVSNGGGPIALGRCPAAGKRAWFADPVGLHEAGLAQEPCRTGLRALAELKYHVMSVFVGPRRIIQPGRADPGQDMQRPARDADLDVGLNDGIECRQRIAGRIDGLITAQALQPLRQRTAQAGCRGDRAEAATSGLQPAGNRRVVQFVAHRSIPGLPPGCDWGVASGPVLSCEERRTIGSGSLMGLHATDHPRDQCRHRARKSVQERNGRPTRTNIARPNAGKARVGIDLHARSQ